LVKIHLLFSALNLEQKETSCFNEKQRNLPKSVFYWGSYPIKSYTQLNEFIDLAATITMKTVLAPQKFVDQILKHMSDRLRPPDFTRND
jgi:hypothetical protein